MNLLKNLEKAKLVTVIFAVFGTADATRTPSSFTSFLHLFSTLVIPLLSRGSVRSRRHPRLWRCMERPAV